MRTQEKIKQMEMVMEERIKRVNSNLKDKIEYIREKDNKKVRKNIDPDPGPGEYNVNYNFAYEGSPSYTLSGILDKANIDRYEDPNKIFSLEQSVNMLSKNIQTSLQPLPNFNCGKMNSPNIKFGRSERFEKEKNDLSRKKKYFINPTVLKEENYDPDKIYFIGKSKRFKKLMMSDMPGPGEYKIDGFTGELLRKLNRNNEYKARHLMINNENNLGNDNKNEMNDIQNDNKNKSQQNK